MRTHFIWRGRTPLRAAYSGHGGVAPGAKPPDSASFSPSTALPRHEERRPSPSMRLFWLILLIACVLMAGGRCYGCGETFKRLGRHLDKCDKVSKLHQGGLGENIEMTARLAALAAEQAAKEAEEAERVRAEEERRAAEARERAEVRLR